MITRLGPFSSHLVLPDANGPERLIGRPGERPQEPGQARLLRQTGPDTDIRMPLVKHPLD